MVAEDTLAFAGIAPPALRVYPVETHIAEKLHAYTLPRTRPNSRVKDLPDLALIATAGAIDAGRLRAAIDQTFGFRGTHAVPDSLVAPPDTWEGPYSSIAREDQLRWPTLDAAFSAVRAFLDPVLEGLSDGQWAPEAWSWMTAPAKSENEED